MRKLAVVGSINMDIVNSVEQFPQPGETIHSRSTAFFPGGKGANQAVAAAQAGAVCEMVGAVGRDPFGESLLASLSDKGVGIDAVLKKEGTSGIALITVNGEGENHIMLSPGANGKLTEEDVLPSVDWTDTYAVLLQNEIPWSTTLSVIRSASDAGVKVIFNPAPALAFPDEVFPLLDTLVMNETETAAVTGKPVQGSESAVEAGQFVVDKGVSSVIITLGEEGCVWLDAQGNIFAVPAYRVKPIDTTAAGDTFIGAYAAACAEGMETIEALRNAAAAAALAVTREGAQASIPSRSEIMSFRRQTDK